MSAATELVVHVSGRGNTYMTEIALQLGEAAARLGLGGVVHVDDLPVDDGRLHLVVAPHEFFPLHHADEEALRRAADAAACLNVEQPGTSWFETGAAWIRPGAVCFDINDLGVTELRTRGVDARPLRLGWSPRRDRWGGRHEDRPVDVVHLGDDSPRRIQALVAGADRLTDRRTELRLFRADRPVRPGQPGFLTEHERTALLSRSRVLVNVHRGPSAYFEWVRLLDAMANGCVVVSEPSTHVAPLVPGVHFVEAAIDDLVAAADALLDDEDRRRSMATAAHDLLRRELAQDDLLLAALGGMIVDEPHRSLRAPAWSPPRAYDQPTIVPLADAPVAARTVLDGRPAATSGVAPADPPRSATVVLVSGDGAVADDALAAVRTATAADADRAWAIETAPGDPSSVARSRLDSVTTDALVVIGTDTLVSRRSLGSLVDLLGHTGAASASGIGVREDALVDAVPGRPDPGTHWPVLALRSRPAGTATHAFLHSIVARYR